jgi:hypothetical protein
MAEDAPGGGGDSPTELLTRKVGPLPLWAWAGAFVVIWWYIGRKKTAATTTASGTASGTGTDPAGNTGTLDPLTGYVQGTAEDLASLQQQNAELNGSSSTSGSGSSNNYSSNQQWEQAAINYLVGLGDDSVAANGAISAYLQSQTLTSNQQAMVNSAVLALGAPPDPPAPSTSTTIVSPPGGATTYATNPPTGLAVAATTASSLSLKWNAAKNATGYTVTATPAGSSGSPRTVSVSTPYAVLSGLAASTSYTIKVQATPADTGASSATTTASTGYGVVLGGQPVAAGSSLKPGQQLVIPFNGVGTQVASKFGIAPAHLQQFNPGKAATDSGYWQVPYEVQKNDTLQTIAAKFDISPEHLSQILQPEGVS